MTGLLNKAAIYSFGERLVRRLPLGWRSTLWTKLSKGQRKECKADCKNKFEIPA